MRPLAARGGVDGDRAAAVEKGRDAIEVGIARANQRPPNMNRIGALVTCCRIGNIRRHNQYRDATFGQSRLAGSDRLSPSLLGREDRLAKDAAALEDLLEINFLDRIEADVLAHDLGCDQNDGCAVAIGFIEAVDEME